MKAVWLLPLVIGLAGAVAWGPGFVSEWQADREMDRSEAQFKADLRGAIEAEMLNLKKFADDMHELSQAELDRMGYPGTVYLTGNSLSGDMTIVFNKIDEPWCNRLVRGFADRAEEVTVNG